VDGLAPLGVAAARVALLALAAPLVTGIVQKMKATLQSRQGASVVQPYRDLRKLLRKGTVQSDTASAIFRAVPPLVLAATLTAAAMVPVLFLPGAAGGARLPLGDAILLLSLLALARFLLAVGALDAGGAFGGMGASREMTVGVLVEPVLMLVVFSVGAAVGKKELSDIAARRSLAFRAPDLLALFSMMLLLLAETGRIPVDNPDTHLELTMLHEGMLLEHSGPGLGCLVLATHVKQIVIMAFSLAIFFPEGLAQSLAPQAIAIAAGAFCLKIVGLSIFLALVESSYAKLRFFRLPQFLGMGLLCAFMALALRLL